jgi:hypothetical protein
MATLGVCFWAESSQLHCFQAAGSSRPISVIRREHNSMGKCTYITELISSLLLF